jgi:hypothetical protein
MSAPKIIAIDHDKYSAKYVGRLPDGRQFFLTTPFIPAIGGSSGREFIALFLFDENGLVIEARIEDLGTRAELKERDFSRIFAQWLAELGSVHYRRIEVQPFKVERFGTTFGLVPRPPEEDGDIWAVEMQPGNYMAFFEPWDSGEYDT